MIERVPQKRSDLRRGHCPGVLRPIETGDGLLVRIRCRAGRLTKREAHLVAEAARSHGNGLLDLSARGNLQMRGVSDATLPKLTKHLIENGLADSDAETEHVGAIELDPLATVHCLALYDEIKRALKSGAGLADLPPKFRVMIDTGGPLSMEDIAADVTFRRTKSEQFRVGLGGDAQSESILGYCRQEDIPDLAREISSAFLETCRQCAFNARTMRQLLTHHPDTSRFTSLLSDDIAASVSSASSVDPLKLRQNGHQVGLATTDEPWIGFYLPFGRIGAETLSALADMTSLDVRLTPWRTVLIPVELASVDALNAKAVSFAADHGLELDSDALITSVSACPGSAGCLSGHVEAQRLARRLVDERPDLVRAAREVHVSGCLKGCAHPSRAALTLVGRADGLALVIDGEADASPVATGLSLENALDTLVKIKNEGRSLKSANLMRANG